VIYTEPMAIRVALFVLPAVAMAGLVLLLNGVEATAGMAAASMGLVAVASGAALGYFADHLPELPRASRPHRLAGVHHGD
jgi:hypothetical protein